MKNQVIEVIDREHGRRVIDYWKSKGVDTSGMLGIGTKDGEDYYVINTFFKVLRFTWQSYSFDFDLLKSGNCFKTEEEAQKYADKFSEILKERKL